MLALKLGHVAGVVPAAVLLGLLVDDVVVVGDPIVDLSLDFVGDGSADGAEAVEVFHFADGGAVFAAMVDDSDVDVGLEAHLPFLHAAFADAEVGYQSLKFGAEGAGFVG